MTFVLVMDGDIRHGSVRNPTPAPESPRTEPHAAHTCCYAPGGFDNVLSSRPESGWQPTSDRIVLFFGVRLVINFTCKCMQCNDPVEMGPAYYLRGEAMFDDARLAFAREYRFRG